MDVFGISQEASGFSFSSNGGSVALGTIIQLAIDHFEDTATERVFLCCKFRRIFCLVWARVIDEKNGHRLKGIHDNRYIFIA